jgi:hypothetical protein
MVRGAKKVFGHLMFGLLVLSVDQLIRLIQFLLTGGQRPRIIRENSTLAPLSKVMCYFCLKSCWFGI